MTAQRIETLAEGISLYAGGCLDVLKALEPDSIDACVTDPPYHLTTNKNGGTGVASDNRGLQAGTLNFRFALESPAPPARDWLCCHSHGFERTLFIHNMPSAADGYRMGVYRGGSRVRWVARA